jgi:hypothetical protein
MYIIAMTYGDLFQHKYVVTVTFEKGRNYNIATILQQLSRYIKQDIEMYNYYIVNI